MIRAVIIGDQRLVAVVHQSRGGLVPGGQGRALPGQPEHGSLSPWPPPPRDDHHPALNPRVTCPNLYGNYRATWGCHWQPGDGWERGTGGSMTRDIVTALSNEGGIKTRPSYRFPGNQRCVRECVRILYRLGLYRGMEFI